MAGKLGITRYEAHNGLTVTFSAAVNPNDPVSLTGDKTVAQAAAGDVVIGTVIKAGAAGETGTIRLRGDVVPMTAAGTLAAGDQVVGNAGKVQALNGTTPESGHAVLGVVLKGGAADSEVLVVVL